MMLRRMDAERAPAAAEIEERLAGVEAQLAAAHLELVLLRLRQTVVPLGEIGAAIDHLGIEPERVEGVREVVVMRDVLLVLGGAAVALAFLADGLERPGPAARREHEFGRGAQEQRFAQQFAHLAGADRWPARHEIEDRAVAYVDAGGGPEI